MKAISITSIICGTLLVLAPIAHDIFLNSLIAHLLETTREPASITGSLNSSYYPWCMFIGVCAIVSGLFVGIRFRSAIEASHGARPLSNAAPSGI
jgi:hypothetical protein